MEADQSSLPTEDGGVGEVGWDVAGERKLVHNGLFARFGDGSDREDNAHKRRHGAASAWADRSISNMPMGTTSFLFGREGVRTPVSSA